MGAGQGLKPRLINLIGAVRTLMRSESPLFVEIGREKKGEEEGELTGWGFCSTTDYDQHGDHRL